VTNSEGSIPDSPAAAAKAAPRLVLASASPRRRSLLEEAGYQFIVHPAEIDEEAAAASSGGTSSGGTHLGGTSSGGTHLGGTHPGGTHPGAARQASPIELAQRLARTKARAVAAEYPDDVVLAADTVVALGDQTMGKPTDAEQARAMLTLLEGTTHIVITAVAVLGKNAGISLLAHVMSAVRMAPLTPGEIDRYVATNQWQGKAGAYGIQDDDPFVERLRGCHTNIVGLPMKTTKRLLESAGIFPDKPKTTP